MRHQQKELPKMLASSKRFKPPYTSMIIFFLSLLLTIFNIFTGFSVTSDMLMNILDPPLSPEDVLLIPRIEELARTAFYDCPNGLLKMEDTYVPTYKTHWGRKIPRVIHMTAKSRCVTPEVYVHLQKWRLQGHSFYFHDDYAVDRLLYANHSGTAQELIPNMTEVLSCITNGATKSDIWRYLVLWHYGGIYVSI